MAALLLPATFVLALTVDAAAAPSGAPSREQEPTNLTLGEASAPPGSPVTAPLTLSVPEGAEVGSLKVRLTYPKALLTFEKVEPSGLSLGVGAAVDATVEEGLGGKSSTLAVTISTGSPPPKALPPGPLAYIGFRISDRAEPESTIPLTHSAEAFGVGDPPRRVEPISAAPAAIQVSAPAVPACFFYMH
jgi:hypothetical protein